MDFSKSVRTIARIKKLKSKHSPRRYKYGPSGMSPQDQINFLRTTAADIPIDPLESIQSYFQLSRDLFKQGSELLEAGRDMDAYIIFVRFYSIFSTRIKTHPGYRSIGESNAKQLSKNCAIAEKRIANLEATFLSGFSKGPGTRQPLPVTTQPIQKQLQLLSLLQKRMILTRTKSQLRELEHRLSNLFTSKGTNSKGYMNESDVQLLLFKLGISQDPEDSKRFFGKYKKPMPQDGDAIGPEEFIDFFATLMRFPAVERIFNEYKSSDGFLSASALHKFLTANQGLHSKQYSVADCTRLIAKHESSETKGQMSLSGFQDFLLSPEFSVFKSKYLKVYQDMSMPLSNYYISSATNPFISETPLKSPQSLLEKILLDGCRSIDLQIWDGGTSYSNEPIIKLGEGSTAILFKDILQNGIKPHAFTASKFPLFLCLEINCEEDGRRKAASLLQNILGDSLLKVDVKTLNSLPSPIHLQRKIIIRASNSLQLDLEGPKDVQEPSRIFGIDEVDPVPPKANSISALVNISQEVKFQSFESPPHYFYNSYTFTGMEASLLAENQGKDFISYNQTHLSKVTQSSESPSTSNLDPFAFWISGSQLVGIDYLNTDTKWLGNRIFFSENGNSGYILKPRILRDPSLSFDPADHSGIPAYEKYLKLRLEIISGHFLPQPTRPQLISPYIKVQIMGFNHDKQGFETEVVNHNGFNPVWNTTLEFNIYSFDFAMLFLIVYDGAKENNSGRKDTKLGFFGIPVLALNSGYRFLHLLDKVGNNLAPSVLFVNIEKTFQSLAKKEATPPIDPESSNIPKH